MGRCLFPFVLLAGCAQVAGIEQTSGRGDAAEQRSDVPISSDARVDALPCAGGDVARVDPASGACYLLFGAEMTRVDARAACQARGAHLVKLDSAAETTFVMTLIGSMIVAIGASDLDVEGTFRWDDGTAVVLTNWNAMEPNNGMGMFEEDCVIMHGELAGKWDDRPCGPVMGTLVPGTYPFVCERE